MPDEICDLLCLDLPRAEALRATRLGTDESRDHASRAKALGDPTRLMLAHALREGPLCVCDLAWVAERSQNLVSHHVKVMRQSGLVESKRDGKMVMYSLSAGGRSLLAAVLGDEVAA